MKIIKNEIETSLGKLVYNGGTYPGVCKDINWYVRCFLVYSNDGISSSTLYVNLHTQMNFEIYYG